MDFSEALILLKQGKKVRRKVWVDGHTYWRGVALEIVNIPPVMPQLVISYPGTDVLRPFSGANWDLLGKDGELAPE